MDNGAMENFFGRRKVEMFYGEKFDSVNSFLEHLKAYIDYYNNERISLKLKGMSPVQFRTHYMKIKIFTFVKSLGFTSKTGLLFILVFYISSSQSRS